MKRKLNAVRNATQRAVDNLTVMDRDPRPVEPRFDWHLIKVEKSEGVTPRGIIIPDALRVNEAVIVKSGPGRLCDDGVTTYPMVGKVGDRVICNSNPKVFAVVDGETIFGIRDCEIAFVVQERQASPIQLVTS